MIYFVLGILFLLISICEIIEQSKLKSFGLSILVSFIMVLFASLRDKVGTDWLAYYEFYQYKVDTVEIGYACINNWFSTNNLHYNLFLFTINFTSIILLWRTFGKFAIFPAFAMLLYYSDYYLYYNLSGIRQAIALSFTCLSIIYALRKNLLLFIVCIGIATCFHISSITFLFAYFIPKKTLNSRQITLLILSLSTVSFVIYLIANFLPDTPATKILYYIEDHEKEQNIISAFIIGAFRRTILFVMVFFFKKNYFDDIQRTFFFNIYLIGYLIFLATYLVSPDIGVRVSSYFLIFDIIIIGNLLWINKKSSTKLLIVGILSIVSLYKISTYTKISYYNYQSIF